MKQQPAAQEQQIILQMLEFADNPEAFVMYAFPWGKPNSPLADFKGPREWQLKALRKMRAHILENHRKQSQGLDPELLQLARASGRGIGKSALLAWVALWLFSCRGAQSTLYGGVV